MQNSVLDPQDQRKSSSMEDSTAMTIEFLRARLLSERSVSRSARHRADELAKKVMELEEQLRMVTFQRKMAEKATAEVLAILENRGISDVSEEFDLGSDIESPSDSGVSNDSASTKGGGRSTSSIGRRYGSAELSGSNVDSSPAPGKSLSWKGRLDSSCSFEKHMTSNVRRRSSFSSISFPKHRTGKSCRRIKHRETRSGVEESGDKPVNVNCQENEAVSSSEGFPNGSDGGHNILRMASEIRGQDESELKLANKNHDVDGSEREKNMERALEHQAQLIDQYAAMEKAQREWEEKFRENNSSTPESCDQGNHSDITEERDESKAQIPCSARVVTSSAEEDRSEATGVCLSEEMLKAEPRDNRQNSYDDTGYNNQNSTTVSTSGLPAHENSHSQLKDNQKESQESCHSQPSDRHYQGPSRHDFPDSKRTDAFPTDVHSGLPLKDAARNKNGLNELVSHEQSREFSGVLESLEQAKLSLLQEINRLPLVESQYTGTAIKTSAPVSKGEDIFDLPVGYSGLFRLPTDFSDEATARFNVHDSTSGFSSNFYPGRGISRTSGVQFGTNPYSGTMLSFSADVQSLATRSTQTWARFDPNRAPSVPLLDGGLLSPGKYMFPPLPISSSYQNATPPMSFGEGLPISSSYQNATPPISSSYQNATPPMSFGEGLPISSSYQNATPMSFGEGLSRTYSSSTVGVPPASNFSFHGDHVR